MKKTKAVSYCRVSSNNQLYGHGFSRQESTIKNYANKNNFEVIKTYREVISGTKDFIDRPMFTEMIDDLLNNGCKTIIIENLDRLARKYSVQESIILYLVNKGINLIISMTGENVTNIIDNNPLKEAMIQMQSTFAQLDSGLLKRRLKKGRERKRKLTGRCEGRKPHYKNSDILKEIRKLRRKPKSKKRKTYKEVAEVLNQRGYINGNGGKFTGGNVARIIFRMQG